MEGLDAVAVALAVVVVVAALDSGFSSCSSVLF